MGLSISSGKDLYDHVERHADRMYMVKYDGDIKKFMSGIGNALDEFNKELSSAQDWRDTDEKEFTPISTAYDDMDKKVAQYVASQLSSYVDKADTVAAENDIERAIEYFETSPNSKLFKTSVLKNMEQVVEKWQHKAYPGDKGTFGKGDIDSSLASALRLSQTNVQNGTEAKSYSGHVASYGDDELPQIDDFDIASSSSKGNSIFSDELPEIDTNGMDSLDFSADNATLSDDLGEIDTQNMDNLDMSAEQVTLSEDLTDIDTQDIISASTITEHAQLSDELQDVDGMDVAGGQSGQSSNTVQEQLPELSSISDKSIHDDIQHDYVVPDECADKVGYSQSTYDKIDTDDNEIDIVVDQLPDIDDDPLISYDTLMYPYYGMLTDLQKKLYSKIYSYIDKGQMGVKIQNNSTVNDVKVAYEALMNDRPNLFWVDGGFSYAEYSNGSVGYAEIKVNSGIEYSQDIRDKVESIVKAKVASIDKSKSTLEIEREVHDFVVQSITYDISMMKSGKGQTAYEALVMNRCVCAGYSRAFQYIMMELGFPCYYVTGYAGEPHAWNIVCVDGRFTNVDTTWDDQSSGVIYDYFNKSDTFMLKNRRRDGLSVNLPACDDIEDSKQKLQEQSIIFEGKSEQDTHNKMSSSDIKKQIDDILHLYHTNPMASFYSGNAFMLFFNLLFKFVDNPDGTGYIIDQIGNQYTLVGDCFVPLSYVRSQVRMSDFNNRVIWHADGSWSYYINGERYSPVDWVTEIIQDEEGPDKWSVFKLYKDENASSSFARMLGDVNRIVHEKSTVGIHLVPVWRYSAMQGREIFVNALDSLRRCFVNTNDGRPWVFYMGKLLPDSLRAQDSIDYLYAPSEDSSGEYQFDYLSRIIFNQNQDIMAAQKAQSRQDTINNMRNGVQSAAGNIVDVGEKVRGLFKGLFNKGIGKK